MEINVWKIVQINKLKLARSPRWCLNDHHKAIYLWNSGYNKIYLSSNQRFEFALLRKDLDRLCFNNLAHKKRRKDKCVER